MISVEQFQIFHPSEALDRGLEKDYRYRLSARSRNYRFRMRERDGGNKSLWMHSFNQGLEALKRNAKPAFVVQGLIAILVFCYYFFPSSRFLFDGIKKMKEAGGFLFCFILMGGAVSILVEMLRIFVVQNKKIEKQNVSNFVFTFCVFGLWGIFTHLFFNFQGRLIGVNPGFGIVIKKALIDRIIWGPFVAIPYQIFLYTWRKKGFSLGKTWHELKSWRSVLQKAYLPILITNQGFWIPMSLLLYCFPVPLQFPIAVLVLSLWVLLLNTVLKT